MLFPTLWSYRTSVKNARGFTPFQLVHGVEFVLPIECEIPSLKIAMELFPDTTSRKERLLCLEKLEEHRRDFSMANEVHKKRVNLNTTKVSAPGVKWKILFPRLLI